MSDKKRVVGIYLPEPKRRIIFNSLEEASEYTHISVKRIENCIETGHKWWQWIFDEEM